MAKEVNSYNYLEVYLNEIRTQGRYAFAWNELKEQFNNLTDKALNQNLYRLKSKGKVAQIRKGFYAIIPPEYSIQGMLPVYLFIDDLMKSLNRRYYVGLISAAALHGAAHQQPMESFIIIEKPALRDIKNQKIKINFYVKKNWDDQDIIQKKTDAGYINVSSPELTALDLLYYIDSIGINRTATILKELSAEIKPENLMRVAKSYPQTAAIQRLGYLLSKEIHNEALANAIAASLKERRLFQIPLSPATGNTNGATDPDWKIIQNVKIESDL
jgi:predicted transcriptional regulator of viral defense system